MNWNIHRLIPHRQWLLIDLPLFIANRVIAYLPSRRIRFGYYRRIMRYRIGAQSAIFMGAWFDSVRGFEMGSHSVVNQGCRMDTRGGITIGDNVSIAADVCILTADHDPQSSTFAGRISAVKIDDYAFIGTKAMLLPGVVIGYGAIVAAGAIVTKSVAPFEIVAGVPAKLIGRRTTELKYELSYSRFLN